MSKVEGIKLVRVGGAVDLDRALACWDAREIQKMSEARTKFLTAVNSHQDSFSMHEEAFETHLKAFWAKFPSVRGISKSVVVSMTCAMMVEAGVFGLGDLAKMTELFSEYLEDQIETSRGDGCWLRQGSKRDGAPLSQVRKEDHIR